MSVQQCPVCRAQMREVDRDGVQIDVCTQCRGVWLDRGELEKLSSFIGDGARRDDEDRQRGGSRSASSRRSESWFGRDDDDGDDDRRRDAALPQRSRTRGFLDFFD